MLLVLYRRECGGNLNRLERLPSQKTENTVNVLFEFVHQLLAVAKQSFQGSLAARCSTRKPIRIHHLLCTRLYSHPQPCFQRYLLVDVVVSFALLWGTGDQYNSNVAKAGVGEAASVCKPGKSHARDPNYFDPAIFMRNVISVSSKNGESEINVNESDKNGDRSNDNLSYLEGISSEALQGF